MASVLSQIIMRGLIADRPSADTPGRLYFSTDESRMYRDNGTTWDEVSPVPGDHAASHALGGDDEVTLDPTQITGTAVVDDDPRLTDAREPLAHAASHAPEGSDPLTGFAAAAHAATHELGGDDELLLDPTQIDGTAAVLADLNGYVDSTTFANFRSDVFNGLIGSASASSEGPTVSDAETDEVLRDFSTDADAWQTLATFSGIAGWSDPTVLANVIVHLQKLDAGTAALEMRAVYDTVEGDPIAFSMSTDYRSIVLSFMDAELLNGGTDLEIQWRLQDPFDSYSGSISSDYRSIDIWTGYLPLYRDAVGAPNGVASLDGDGLVPVEQIPVLELTGFATDEELFDARRDLAVEAQEPPVTSGVASGPSIIRTLNGATRDFSSGGTSFETLNIGSAAGVPEGFIGSTFFLDLDPVDTETASVDLEFEWGFDSGTSGGGYTGPTTQTIDPRVYNQIKLESNLDVAPDPTDDDTQFFIRWRDVSATAFEEVVTVRQARVKVFTGIDLGAAPVPHAATHEDGGDDELTLAPAQITGTAIVEAAFDAKGDLLTATAADSPAILTVGTDGQILMAASGETTGLQWVDNHAEQVRLTVKNMTGTAIAKGKAVYIDGVSGTIPTVVLADASTDATSAYTLGLTGESIADGATGFVITQGILRNISTTGLTGGAPVWLSETAGEVTATKPTQPVHGVLIGYAVRIHGSNGEIYVFTQNGYELGELHDVLLGASPAEKNVLSYDATATVWKNRTLAQAGIASTAHATTHEPGGTDAMAVDAIAATGSLRTLGTSATSAAAGNHTHSATETINVIIDGGGVAITTGVKADLLIPYGATITAARLLADQTGSIVVDIWKDTYANFPPTVADSITASAKPTLSSAAKSEDTTLTGWTTALSAGDYLRFNVDSVTTVTRVTLALTITRTI